MLSNIQLFRGLSLAVVALYGVELLDELIYGLHGVVVPYLRDDFALTYTQVGLLFTLPGLVAVITEPLIGLLGDTRHRRLLVMGGIGATAAGLAIFGAAQSYGVVLAALCVMFPASGAYVNLAQATLIDRDATRAEQTMARWTLLGEIGVTIAPLIATIIFALGHSWRGAYFTLAVIAGAFAIVLISQRFDQHTGADSAATSLRSLVRSLLGALRHRALLKWIVLAELADFMLDKLLEVTGLYFRDVAGVSLAGASAAVAVSTIAGLIGSLVIVPLLDRVGGLRVVRQSAVVVLIAYVAFLIVPSVEVKYALIALISFSTASWFAVLRAKAFEVLPGQSGLVVAVTSLANVSSLFVPVLLGGLADALGLPVAMALLLIGPVALIYGVR